MGKTMKLQIAHKLLAAFFILRCRNGVAGALKQSVKRETRCCLSLGSWNARKRAVGFIRRF